MVILEVILARGDPGISNQDDSCRNFQNRMPLASDFWNSRYLGLGFFSKYGSQKGFGFWDSFLSQEGVFWREPGRGLVSIAGGDASDASFIPDSAPESDVACRRYTLETFQ
jgi:hypothetical protein